MRMHLCVTVYISMCVGGCIVMCYVPVCVCVCVCVCVYVSVCVCTLVCIIIIMMPRIVICFCCVSTRVYKGQLLATGGDGLASSPGSPIFSMFLKKRGGAWSLTSRM